MPATSSGRFLKIYYLANFICKYNRFWFKMEYLRKRIIKLYLQGKKQAQILTKSEETNRSLVHRTVQRFRKTENVNPPQTGDHPFGVEAVELFAPRSSSVGSNIEFCAIPSALKENWPRIWIHRWESWITLSDKIWIWRPITSTSSWFYRALSQEEEGSREKIVDVVRWLDNFVLWRENVFDATILQFPK